MSSENEHVGPVLMYSLLEARAFAEMAMVPFAYPLVNRLPKGEGKPVMLIPGFMARDQSMAVLRHWLKRLGYNVHGWQQGRNTGLSEDKHKKLGERLTHLAEQYGQPVRLIGWSLGGIQCRALAHSHPDLVNSVITLGTPFRLPGVKSVKGLVARLYDRVNTGNSSALTNPEAEWQHSPPVPSTAIYSKLDGIANWDLCVDHPEGNQTENLCVLSSHSGMGSNPEIMLLLAHRLHDDKESWIKFDPSLVRRFLRFQKPSKV